jgi:hypothetical protein
LRPASRLALRRNVILSIDLSVIQILRGSLFLLCQPVGVLL